MELHVAAIQMQCINFRLRDNLDCAARSIRTAAAAGAELILLPEFFHIGYWYDRRLRQHVEPIGGHTTDWLLQWSKRTGALIGGCIAEQHGKRVYDTFLLATPKGNLHSYRKRHPAFFENLYFARGRDEGIFDTEIGRIGVMICWDMAQAKLATAMENRIDWLVISAAWPDMVTGNWPLPFFQSWISKLGRNRPRELATTLQTPTLYSNLTGSSQTRVPGLGIRYRSNFAGHSAIVDGHGQVVSSCQREETVVHGFIGRHSRVLPHAA